MKPILTETTEAKRLLQTTKGSYLSYHPDKIIAKKGWAYIKDIERDSHYGSCLNTRIQDVVGKKWDIKPYYDKKLGKITKRDIEIADFVRDQLIGIPTFETDIIAMFDHISKGFSLSEINYKIIKSGRWKGKIGLKNIRKKDPEQFKFVFDKYGYYKPYMIDPYEKELDPNKFIHFINGRDDENPYGESVASLVAFWVWLKKNGAKFWAIYLERYGMPLSLVDIPDNIAPGSKEYQKAETVLNAMLKESGIIKPKSFDIRFLEAARAGSANYDGFLKRCNAEISKIVLGQTLSIDEGVKGSGTHAQAAIHAGVLKNYTLFDVIISAAAINSQLIRRLVDLNFVTEHYPVFEWKAFDISMLTVLAQNIKSLIDAGLKISAKFVYEAIGIEMPEDDKNILESQANGKDNPKGLDNKAKGFSEDIPKPIKGLKEKEEINKLHIKENDEIVDNYTKILADKYDKIKKEISKKNKITPEQISKIIKTNISKPIEEILILGYLQGKKHAFELLKNQKNNYKDDNYYAPFDQLLKDFLGLYVVTKAEYKILQKEMKRKAFTIAGIESEYLLEKIKAEMGNILKSGGSWTDLKNKINNILKDAGVLELSPNHLEVVIRNNLQEQYSIAKEELYKQMDKEKFPTKTVLPIRDSRTRESHLKLYGFTRPVDDPIWEKLKTPFAHNCRCTIILNHKDDKIPITKEEPDLSGKDFIFIN